MQSPQQKKVKMQGNKGEAGAGEVRQARTATHTAASRRRCSIREELRADRLVSCCRRHRHVQFHPLNSYPTRPPPRDACRLLLARHTPPRERARHFDLFTTTFLATSCTTTTTTDGAAAAVLLRPKGRRRDGVGAGRDGRRPPPPAAAGGGPRSGAGGAVRVAGVRRLAAGRRGGGAAGTGFRGRSAGGRRRPSGGGAGVPRRLLGPPVEGPLRVQLLDRAPEGLRGVAPPRHALHAPGRRPGPRPLRRHRAGCHRAGRPRRAALPGARHEGDVPAAEPDDAAGVVHGDAAQPGRGQRRRRERAGGAVRERAGDRLRARREQGQVAAQRPRGAPHGEGGGREGGRLGEEGRVGDRPVHALGRIPRRQVRRRPLRPERRAPGARRPALRPAEQRLRCGLWGRGMLHWHAHGGAGGILCT